MLLESNPLLRFGNTILAKVQQ